MRLSSIFQCASNILRWSGLAGVPVVPPFFLNKYIRTLVQRNTFFCLSPDVRRSPLQSILSYILRLLWFYSILIQDCRNLTFVFSSAPALAVRRFRRWRLNICTRAGAQQFFLFAVGVRCAFLSSKWVRLLSATSSSRAWCSFSMIFVSPSMAFRFSPILAFVLSGVVAIARSI